MSTLRSITYPKLTWLHSILFLVFTPQTVPGATATIDKDRFLILLQPERAFSFNSRQRLKGFCRYRYAEFACETARCHAD
jgi:hypothetical protein